MISYTVPFHKALSISSPSRTYGNEASPRMCHNVETKAMMKKRNMAFLQKLGVRNSDIDIIEVMQLHRVGYLNKGEPLCPSLKG